MAQIAFDPRESKLMQSGQAEHIERLAESVRKWAVSQEAQASIKQAVERDRKSAAQFSDSLRVDPLLLYQPFTL